MGCANTKSKRNITKASVVPLKSHHRRHSSTSTAGTISNNNTNGDPWDTVSTNHSQAFKLGHVDGKAIVVIDDHESDVYRDTSVTNDVTPMTVKSETQGDDGSNNTMSRLDCFSDKFRVNHSGFPGRVTERALYEEESYNETFGEIERISSFVKYTTADLQRMESFGNTTVISNDDTLDRAGDFRMNTEQLLASVTSIDFCRTDTFDHASPDLSPEKRKRRINNFVREKSFTHIPEDISAEETLGKSTAGAFGLPTQYSFIDAENKSEVKVALNLSREFDLFANLEHNGDYVKGCTLYVSHNQQRNIKCRFPQSGEYQLHILAKKRDSEEEYAGVFTYFIDNAAAFDGCAEFPEAVSMKFSKEDQKMTSHYIEDVEILSPVSKVLKRGHSYDITLLAPKAEDIKYCFDTSKDKVPMTTRGDFFCSKITIPELANSLKLVWTEGNILSVICFTIEA